MAKFRNGNLVLTSSQTIVQGSTTVLDSSRKGLFNSLQLDATLTNISEFSTDTTLAGNSDAVLPTEKAVKTYINTQDALVLADATAYVDAQISDLAPNKISQLDSKVEVTDSGSNGKIVLIADNTQVFQISAKADNAFYSGTTDPTNTTRLNYDGYFYATRVYNAIWNDIADFQDLAEPEFFAGKCYYDTVDGAKVCNTRCQKSVIGIASDTFGFGVGQDSSRTQVSIAIGGWVLAYVNDSTSCVPGDVLTNDTNGNLVKMTDEEKSLYPERIVAIYKRGESREVFGPNEVPVNGRHWVKVK